MDAMQENAPRAKMARSAVFSRPGRWMLRRTLSGRKRIHRSRTMLVALVAVEGDLVRKGCVCWDKGGVRTVYKNGGVDAVAWYAPSDVPHLVQWLTLRQDDDDAGKAEGDEEVNCAFTKSFKCFRDSYEQSSVNCTC
jgi:hypothetical protein